MTGPLTVLVDQFSATRGRQIDSDDALGLHLDHSELVKYKFEDENYKLVQDKMLSIVKDVLQSPLTARMKNGPAQT
jgi:hypothetical protein